MKLFDGTVAVITGATGGIGGASARLFAREGAKLVLGYRSATEQSGIMCEASKSSSTLILNTRSPIKDS